MLARIGKILDRELSRLDERSSTSGFSIEDWRSLDLLIKSLKQFLADADDKKREGIGGADEASLLDGVADDPAQ